MIQMSILLLVLGLIFFVGLVVVHEFGHFLAARRNGVEIEEFAIGFPPRIWSKRLKGGTIFSVNWLPLGGFVKLKGENDSSTEKGSFGDARLKAKVKIMTAGVVMNLLVALVLLTILALVGMPKVIDNQFSVKSDVKVIKDDVLLGHVEAGSPADKAGLKEGDALLSFSTREDEVTCLSLDCPVSHEVNVMNENQLPQLTESLAGQTVQIKYQRGSETSSAEAQLLGKEEVEASKNTDNPKGYLGISPSQYTLERSTWSAPVVAVGLAKQITVATFKGIGHALASLFQGDTAEASKQVAGPVGIFVLLKNGSLLGYQFMLFIIAVISLTLAIMNILPIPALDGGRLFVTLAYRGLRKNLTKKAENIIHGLGFAFLMLLFLLITVVDVKRFL